MEWNNALKESLKMTSAGVVTGIVIVSFSESGFKHGITWQFPVMFLLALIGLTLIFKLVPGE